MSALFAAGPPPIPTARELVTRAEAAPRLGFAGAASLKAIMWQQRGRWPEPVACALYGPRTMQWDWAELAAAAPRHARSGQRSRRADGLVTCLGAAAGSSPWAHT